MDLTSYYETVEQCIERLNIKAEEARGERPGQWSMQKGSAKVWLDLWNIEKESRAYFQVMSPVMPVPKNVENREGLYEELLVINDKLFGCAFTLYNDWVWLKTIREVEGMDVNEAFAMLTRVGNYADDYDDYLIEKYLEEPGDEAYDGARPQRS